MGSPQGHPTVHNIPGRENCPTLWYIVQSTCVHAPFGTRTPPASRPCETAHTSYCTGMRIRTERRRHKQPNHNEGWNDMRRIAFLFAACLVLCVLTSSLALAQLRAKPKVEPKLTTIVKGPILLLRLGPDLTVSVKAPITCRRRTGHSRLHLRTQWRQR